MARLIHVDGIYPPPLSVPSKESVLSADVELPQMAGAHRAQGTSKYSPLDGTCRRMVQKTGVYRTYKLLLVHFSNKTLIPAHGYQVA
jgi:hypothetical protein